MRSFNKVSEIVNIGIILILISGCSSFLTSKDRAMTLEDIINLSKTKIDSEVIIRQIEVTHSKFKLETSDIIRLKNEGVDDDVIEYMIKKEFSPERFRWKYDQLPYNYQNYSDRYYHQFNDEYYYYYSPFWDGLRGVPYHTYQSPYGIRRFYRRHPIYSPSNLLELYYGKEYFSPYYSYKRRPRY